jgi:hypothetical protein
MYSHKQKYKLDLINWIHLQKSNNFQFLSKEIYVLYKKHKNGLQSVLAYDFETKKVKREYI